MNLKYYLTIFLISGFYIISTGQESLVSISSYPAKSKAPTQVKSSGPFLSLPFIEDFSSTNLYPDPDKWEDAHVLINNSFPLNQLGYGVATFDAIDSTGQIYEDAKTSAFTADHLTSRSLNLDLGGDTSVYLSFFYQPQGLGDAPEPTDSLVLEFFTPQTNRWIWIWSQPGSQSHDFKQVMIPVRGALFMQAGFKFRFRNYATLADSYNPGLKVNADHWHIDYVYLNSGRGYQDTTFNDLSIVRGSGTLLLEYSALPWEHFQEAGINQVKTIFPIDINNLSGNRKFYSPIFTISDNYGTTSGYEKSLTADEIGAFQSQLYDATFNYGFTSNARDSAVFTVEINLNQTDNDLIPGNSIIQSQQIFTNYYAYDDGTAEAGYGITGEGTSNAQVAMRFKNFLSKDSLVGVSFFFNRSFEDVNHKFFNLAIWDEIDGQPGNLLYTQDGIRTSYSGGLSAFETFLLDTAQVLPSVYYIGWKQVTEDYLNIGYDLNTNRQSKLFYRLIDQWKNSSYNGCLMIHPVFSNRSRKTGIDNPFDPEIETKILAFPNPVADRLSFTGLPLNPKEHKVIIMDLAGRHILSQALTESIDMSGFKNGTYLLVITHQNALIHRQKILVYHE